MTNLFCSQSLKNLLFTFALVIGHTSSASPDKLSAYIANQYQEMKAPEGVKPAFDLYERGLVGYYNLIASGRRVTNQKLTLIDFRLSSKKKRMWVIDMKTNSVLYYRLVAHGKNTGAEYARRFSNTRHSNQSSLGFYLTGETYIGKHGLSLRLDGMEPGFNNEARPRAIVMHSANYVSREFINTYGRLGRSFGCPAIATNKHKEIIKGLAGKSVLFIYAKDEAYEKGTKLLDQNKALSYIERHSPLFAKSQEASL